MSFSSKMDQDARPVKRRRVESMQSSTKKFKKLKKPQLPRPKNPVTFTMPKNLTPNETSNPTSKIISNAKDVRSRSSTPTINPGSESPLLRLTRINILLTVIHRRNKNQHRNQPFYRQLSFLRRSVKKLVALHEQLVELTNPASVSTAKQTSATALDTRQRFEAESRLRSHRDILEEHIRETIVPAAYIVFSGVVADSQFANLGIVLLGVLADVAGTVGMMKRIEKVQHVTGSIDTLKGAERGGPGGRLVGLSTLVTGPDHGKVVERFYDSDGGAGDGIKKKMLHDAYKQNSHSSDFDMGEIVSREEPTTSNMDDKSSNMKRGATTKGLVESGIVLTQNTTTDDEEQNRPNVSAINSKIESNNAVSDSNQAKALDIASNSVTQPSPTKQPQTKSESKDSKASRHKRKDNSHFPASLVISPLPAPSASTLTLSARTAPQANQPPPTANSDSTTAMAEEPQARAAPNMESPLDTGTTKAKEKKKKSKKKGNAIDDLFSGFG